MRAYSMATPLAHQNLADFVAERLLRKIEHEKLMPGGRLGTERALAGEFGVSVRALREAVARLRMLGVLVARQGVGLLVARINPASLLSKVLPVYASQNQTIGDLYLLRRSIELGAIDIAVKNASQEQVEKLLSVAEEYGRAVKGNRRGRPRDELGLTFHRTILEATGNEFLQGMGRIVEQYFLRAAREIKGWPNIKDRVSHLRIARAFKARDAKKAWSLMSRHLRMWKAK